MLVNISTASRELGVSQEHIWRMIRAKRWPAYRLGPKATRLDVTEIRALGKLIYEGEREAQAIAGEGQ